MSTTTRAVTAAALAALVTGAIALPASADDNRPPIPKPVDEVRAMLCERVPAALDRMTARIEALEAGEDVPPGTPQGLGLGLGRAEGRGHHGGGRMLEHRADRPAVPRVDRLERLKENVERLTRAQDAYCTGS